MQNDVLPSLGHTRKPENRSSSQAGPSETQSKETHSQSKLGSAHKQKGNQSASKSASNNQSKTVGQKDSPKGKRSDRTKESELRDDRTNISPTSRVIKQKETKQASPGSRAISPGKHKQAVDDKDHPEKEKKQRLAADVVATADLEGDVLIELRHKKPVFGVSDLGSDTNQAVQLQKMDRSLKFEN